MTVKTTKKAPKQTAKKASKRTAKKTVETGLLAPVPKPKRLSPWAIYLRDNPDARVTIFDMKAVMK